MYKIYSRPRIRLPKIKLYTKAKKMTTLIVIFIIAIFTVKILLGAILPIFDKLCENRAESIATFISNQQANDVIKEYNYDEMYTIEKDKEGNITMIKANVMNINKIVSDVGNGIQEEIDKASKEDVKIPLRKFYWF